MERCIPKAVLEWNEVVKSAGGVEESVQEVMEVFKKYSRSKGRCSRSGGGVK